MAMTEQAALKTPSSRTPLVVHLGIVAAMVAITVTALVVP